MTIGKMKLNNNEIEQNIISCVEEFGGIGLKRLSKVLQGKSTLGEKSQGSKYFGVLSDYSLTDIIAFIHGVIDKKLVTVSKFRGNDVVSAKRNSNFENEESKNIPHSNNIVIPTESDDENITKALKLLSENKNVFITGHAGTGKSYILEKLKEIIPDIVITSTTGIAAVNVKGQTLHSWAGIGICNQSVEKRINKILGDYSISKRIRDCKILAIDEVSMLDIKTFEYTDQVLRSVRSIDKPFGGIQVIFIGDFYQLPPVDNGNPELQNGYCFESELWQEFDFQTVLLTKNYRQNEENLIKALSDIRINAMTQEDEKLLRTRVCDNSEDLSDILHIFSTNEESYNYNADNFAKIDAPAKTFKAKDSFRGKFQFDIDRFCRAEKELELKVGARVMLLINLDFEKCLINGSCGNVLEMDNDYILVKFDNGITSEIKRHNFDFHKKSTLIAKRVQFPLKLAYGITIHKSQGMSLDKLVVDGARIFEKGQMYVALSRIRTLNGLYLINFDPNKIKVDEKVVGFYSNL